MRKRIETPPEVALHADSQQKNPSIDGVDSVTKWQKAATGAIDTAKKATALAKAHLIRESRKHGGRWQWVDFPGPKGRESAGTFTSRPSEALGTIAPPGRRPQAPRPLRHHAHPGQGRR